MTTSRKNLLTFLAAALVLAGGFYYFFIAGSGSETVLPNGAPASQAEISFITLVGRLDPIAFDTSILQNPRFMQLVDIHTAVLPEPQGRTDPFGPLGR